jgi:hypothetical protein
MEFEKYRIHIPIYNQEVLLIVGQPYQAYNFMEETYNIKYSFKGKAGEGMQIDNEENGITDFVLWLNEGYDTDTVVHEVVHISWHLLDYIGIKLDADNHEAQAYLIEFLYNQIMNITAEQEGIKDFLNGDNKEEYNNSEQSEKNIQTVSDHN